MQNPQDPSRAVAPATLRRRLFWLLACTAVGLGIVLLGKHFTSDPRWFLALPAVLAAGWLFFANPDACMASCHRDDGATRHQTGTAGPPGAR